MNSMDAQRRFDTESLSSGGCKLHIAGPVGQGWRVITVWESREASDRFREERLLPAIRPLAGDQPTPTGEPEISAVHELVTLDLPAHFALGSPHRE